MPDNLAAKSSNPDNQRTPRIIITENAGFCFGVERATKIAFDASRDNNRDIYTLGPIIHNPQVVEDLEKKGVIAKKGIDDIDKGTVIIRSHGVSSQEINAAHQKKLHIVDATCPYVKKAQKNARQLSNEGYDVLIVGDCNHPEVRGIVSYAQSGAVYVANSVEQAKKLPETDKLGIVAQTTQSQKNFNDIIEACMTRTKNLRVCNTICDATEVRQDESTELAKKVDVMIVIGGYNSANTKRLCFLCREIQPNTHHIELSAELKKKWFEGASTIGVTAGASTPSAVIEKVREKVEQICCENKL